jgi:hypothetical protein
MDSASIMTRECGIGKTKGPGWATRADFLKNPKIPPFAESAKDGAPEKSKAKAKDRTLCKTRKECGTRKIRSDGGQR